MKSIEDKVTFVTGVATWGANEGIVSFNLTSNLLTPNDDGKTVDPDPAISCRLRMTLSAARTLRDNLNMIFEKLDALGPPQMSPAPMPEGAKAN